MPTDEERRPAGNGSAFTTPRSHQYNDQPDTKSGKSLVWLPCTWNAPQDTHSQLETHANALAAAAQALPSDNLDDTRKVIEAGATAMTHWSSAQEALKCWRAAVDGFRSLATVVRISVDKHSPLVITDASLDVLEPIQVAARSNGTTIDAWTLALANVPLRLATVSDYMERAASYEQQRQAAARRAHERHEEERSVLA